MAWQVLLCFILAMIAAVLSFSRPLNELTDVARPAFFALVGLCVLGVALTGIRRPVI